ncbi:class I SAM-dependent methyltransferase [Aestuariimicrobium kwangyangense]|uniref:class I SAM-dependent methyltransferase n=1 Tax=Aestuariimicrobium kwangyangense TaxID=396389 RepID=UPI0003B4D511|nr:methyltransferase [Aestuariimicrobium kwangyangense]
MALDPARPPADPPALDHGTRLLLDEVELPPQSSVLVVDEPLLADQLSPDHQVSAFCDRGDLHACLPAGVARVEPGMPVDASVALLRLPTSLDQWDEYVGWAWDCGVQQIAAVGREKDLVHRLNDVLGRWFGEVHASRGRNKHRVLHASLPHSQPRVPAEARWPRRALRDGLTIVAHGGTFGTTRLDAGTRLLLAQLDEILVDAADRSRPLRVLDVGSGNGTIAAVLMRALPSCEVTAVDLSWAGAAATRETLRANVAPGQPQPRVLWADGIEVLRESDPFDLIVSNPPFHQGVAKDSAFARDLLDEAPSHLAPGGAFWLVHNTHLPWLPLLRQRHPGAERLAQDRHFSVIRVPAPTTEASSSPSTVRRMPRL